MGITYDTERILMDVDFFNVVLELGAKRRNKFVQCPVHNEKHTDNCSVYYKNGCWRFYCHVCHAHGNAYSYVKLFKENIEGVNCSSDEIWGLLAEVAGEKDSYIIKGSKDSRNYKNMRCPLSNEDASFLGLTKGKQYITIDYSKYAATDDDSIYPKPKTDWVPGLNWLYINDKDAYRYLVKESAKKKMETCKNLMERCRKKNETEAERYLYTNFKELYDKAYRIYIAA